MQPISCPKCDSGVVEKYRFSNGQAPGEIGLVGPGEVQQARGMIVSQKPGDHPEHFWWEGLEGHSGCSRKILREGEGFGGGGEVNRKRTKQSS